MDTSSCSLRGYIQPNEELGTFVVVVYVRDDERPAKGGVGETSGAAIVSSELGTQW